MTPKNRWKKTFLSAKKIFFSIGFLGVCISINAQDLSIKNEFLKVIYNSGSKNFSVKVIPTGKTIATSRELYSKISSVKKTPITDKIYGNGESLVLEGSPGGQIFLFPSLPFVLVQSVVKNDADTAQLFNRIDLASFAINLGLPTDKLVTNGTGGLLSVEKHPGSYAWFALADPKTNNGVVAGWLTQERASGVVFTKGEAETVVINARSDYGTLRLNPSKTQATEVFMLGYFDDARLGLESWADAVAKYNQIKLRENPVGFCTWYCEKNGKASDEVNLALLTDFAEKNLKPWGFSFIQIDDYWQDGDSKKNGPNKNFTRVKPDGPYKSGMKKTADYITSNGFTAGIWFMPFAGSHNDPWFESHPDWFVKTLTGKPYDTKWGGTSLDMTYEPAREYLANYVKQISTDWGYQYFKMDGLWTGTATKMAYINSGYAEDNMGDAVFSNPFKTNIDAYRDGLKLVRNAAGNKVFFLGCSASQNMRSYQGSFGLIDAMRIGPDNSGNWKAWIIATPTYGIRHYHLNGRIWWNDPDPNYLRKGLTLDEARTTTSFASVTGTLNSNSDWIPDLTPDRIEILKRTMLIHKATARPVDYFENAIPNFWSVTDNKTGVRRDLLTIFNWKDTSEQYTLPVEKLKLESAKMYAVFDFWNNKFLPSVTETVTVNLPRHATAVLAIHPLTENPFVLSTSQHVTQGIIDMEKENWDAASKTLSGTSKVVGTDAYELRIASAKYKKMKTLSISAEDKAAGVTITKTINTDGMRVVIQSPTSRSVNWSISF